MNWQPIETARKMEPSSICGAMVSAYATTNGASLRPTTGSLSAPGAAGMAACAMQRIGYCHRRRRNDQIRHSRTAPAAAQP